MAQAGTWKLDFRGKAIKIQSFWEMKILIGNIDTSLSSS